MMWHKGSKPGLSVVLSFIAIRDPIVAHSIFLPVIIFSLITSGDSFFKLPFEPGKVVRWRYFVPIQHMINMENHEKDKK